MQAIRHLLLTSEYRTNLYTLPESKTLDLIWYSECLVTQSSRLKWLTLYNLAMYKIPQKKYIPRTTRPSIGLRVLIYNNSKWCILNFLNLIMNKTCVRKYLITLSCPFLWTFVTVTRELSSLLTTLITESSHGFTSDLRSRIPAQYPFKAIRRVWISQLDICRFRPFYLFNPIIFTFLTFFVRLNVLWIFWWHEDFIHGCAITYM